MSHLQQVEEPLDHQYIIGRSNLLSRVRWQQRPPNDDAIWDEEDMMVLMWL
jgi:hypothetical protein